MEEVAQSSLIPTQLARRIRSLEASLARLDPEAANLSAKITAINEAHTVALNLPTDLQSLTEARDETRRSAVEARDNARHTEDAAQSVTDVVDFVTRQREIVERLVTNIDSAYSAATSVGLAASFTERANSLSRSTWYWVIILFLALCAGGFIGYVRLDAFQSVLDNRGATSQWVWLNAILSILSLAGPIWFAWLATRQIGQRFRLAEDYAFKASVARAYEGYRKEAARLDPKFEARLFASALDRLDEVPLRFLPTEEHGSPYESLLASAGFQKALDKFPDLKSLVLSLAKKAGDHTHSTVENVVEERSDVILAPELNRNPRSVAEL